MRNFWKRIHNDQRGIGLAAILLLIALISGAAMGIQAGTTGTGPAVRIWENAQASFRWLDQLTHGEVVEPQEPEDEVTDLTFVEINTYTSDNNEVSGMLGCVYWPVWNCTASGQLLSYSYRIGRDSSGTRQLRVAVYLWNEDTNMPAALVGYSQYTDYMDFEYRNYPGIQPWGRFTFSGGDDAVMVYEGNCYCLGLQETDGTGRWWENTPLKDTDCEHIIGVWQNISDFYHGGKTYSNSITVNELSAPSVDTIGHAIDEDGAVRLMGQTDVVGVMECGFYIGTNQTLVDNSTATRVIAGYSPISQPRYSFTYRIVDLGFNTTYYYKAFAEIIGQEFYGTVKSLTRYEWEIPVTVQCILTDNWCDGIRFETSLGGLNGSTSYNLSIAYDETHAGMLASNYTIAVTTGAVSDYTWATWTDVGEYFTPGQQYHFRAVAAGNDSSYAYSIADTFVAYDPSQPGPINSALAFLNDTLGGSWTPDNLWWLLAAVGFGLSWIVAAIFKEKWIGIIPSCAIAIALASFGVISPWILVLLVLIAGWIIFKIIFKRAGATGE